MKGPATPPPLPHLRKPEADAEKAASSSPYYGEAKVRKPTGPPPLPSRRGAQSPSAPATPTGDPKPKAETKPEPQAKAAAPGAKSPAAGPVPGPAAPGEVVRPKRSLMLRSKVRALLSALPKGKAKKKPRPDAEPLPEAKTTPTTDLFSPESEAAQTPAPEGWKELAEGDLEPYATDIGQGNLFLGIDRDLDPRTEVPPAPDVRRKEREQEMERDLALRKKTVRLAVRPTPSAETPEAQPPAEPVPEPVPPPSDTGPSNDPKGVRPEQPRLRDQLHAKSTEPEPVELPTVRPAERDKPETVRPEEELPATEVKAPRIEKAPPPEAKPQEPFSRPETKEPLSTISQFGPTRPRQQVSLPKVEMLSKKPQPLLSRQRKAEEDAKLAAQEEARRQAQEEERRRIEEEARRRAEAEAQRRREEEAARRKAEEEAAAKRRAEEEARRKAEEEAAAKRREEEEARRKAEAEATAKRLAEEEARREAQRQEALRRAEEEALRETEESARRQAREGAGELPVSSPTESAEAVDDKPVEEGEGTPAGEAAAHPSIGPVILPPTFSQLHQPSGPRLPGVEQPSDEDFDWSSPPPVEPAAPTEQPTEEPPAAEPVVDESAPAETAKDVPALEPTPVDEPVIEAKSGVQPPPLPTVVEATKPVVDEPAPVESEKGIPAPEPAPADEPVIEAKSGVQPPPLPITVAAAESAPVIETKAPENSDDQAPEASPPETGESEAPKKGWRDPSVVRSQEEREARRVAESEARLRAREQLEARRKSLEQADPSATQAETKKPEPLLARRRKGGGMEPAVRAKQGERARLQPAEKRAAPRDLAGEKPGAEAAAAAAAEKAPLKAPRDMAGDETRQQEKERRKAEVRRRPRKQRKRLSPLVARLIAYPVVIILVLTLAFTTYYSLRETRIDGVVALTADYKVNEAAIVKDFRSEALVISEDLAQARQPLRHDIREREDIIARAQADLAGRKERIRLLREEIDNANKEVEEIIRQARMDSQKILSETGATLEAEYTSKLNALKGMIQRRAAELHLPYEPTTEFESPEIWVNAYRLALYDAPDTIDSAKERMWVEARLTDWKNYEADWNKRQADLKKEVERVQATPKDKIEDVNRRVARLNLRIEETQAEMAPIQAELDGNQKMLDQLVTQDRSLDRPYYEMLLSTPDKNKLYNLHVDGPTGQFSWRDISLKEFPPGNYLLWVKATRGNEVYWSVVPFPLEAYRSQLIVIEEGAFMPLTEVLHNGVGAGAAR